MRKKPRERQPESQRRAIPAVEQVLQALSDVGLSRPIVVAVVRRELGRWRKGGAVPAFETVVDGIRNALETLRRSALRPVINATGVVIHTNLGRAPLGPAAIEALTAIGANYSNLEIDLASGERGRRAAYVEQLLAVLCGAEAATVVNNCTAALVLMLRHFTSGARKEVILSRGELVQIGGGFRIPDVLETSGATLREVGTTNQTTLADYADAIGEKTALVLKVHRSNFFMEGFVDSPSIEALAELARRKRLPLIEDLGSGAVLNTTIYGVDREPTPRESLRRGVGLVCFSGDKLLGGPQAGVIAGKARWVAALKREPFFRALRCDKLILAALEATAEAYARASRVGRGSSPPIAPAGLGRQIPVFGMLKTTEETLHARAHALRTELSGLPLSITVGEGRGRVGGGTLPRAALPSVTLDLSPQTVAPAQFLARLRSGSPPVIGFLSGGRVRLDLRTVSAGQDGLLAEAIRVAACGMAPDRVEPSRRTAC